MTWTKAIDVSVSDFGLNYLAHAVYPNGDDLTWSFTEWLILPVDLSSPWVILGIDPTAQAGLIGYLAQNQTVDGVGEVNIFRQRVTDGLQVVGMQSVYPYQLSYLPYDHKQPYTLSLWTSDTGVSMSSPPPPNWIAPALLNGWEIYGTPHNPPTYRRDAFGVVHLRGLVKNGAMGTTIFTLPLGYRPENTEIFPALTSLVGGIGRVDVMADGSVYAQYADSGYFAMDGVSFYAV